MIGLSGCEDLGEGDSATTITSLGFRQNLPVRIVLTDQYIYVAAAARGVWRRNLNEASAWEYLGLADDRLGNYSNKGAVDLDVHGSDILVAYDAGAPSIDPDSTIAVWRSLDAGNHWVRSDSGIPESRLYPEEYNTISSLQRSPDRPDLVFAVCGNAVYESDDAGRRWNQIRGRRSGGGGLQDYVRWNRYRPGEVWHFGSRETFAPYMYVMSDYGVIRKATVDFDKLGFPSDGSVFDIAFDPVDPGIVYAATSGGMILSNDGGYTWTVGTVRFTDEQVSALVLEHPGRGGVAFFGSLNRIYYTKDHGRSIRAIANLPSGYAMSLAIDPARERLYVGTTDGIYRLDLARVYITM